MKRYFTSLMIAVVMATIVVIAWAPPAKSQVNGDGGCLDFCKEQAICACAKILGGSLRLTQCNILAQCVTDVAMGGWCVCEEVDPICAPWEKDVVEQAFPPEKQYCCPGGVC